MHSTQFTWALQTSRSTERCLTRDKRGCIKFEKWLVVERKLSWGRSWRCHSIPAQALSSETLMLMFANLGFECIFVVIYTKRCIRLKQCMFWVNGAKLTAGKPTLVDREQTNSRHRWDATVYCIIKVLWLFHDGASLLCLAGLNLLWMLIRRSRGLGTKPQHLNDDLYLGSNKQCSHCQHV